MAPTSTVNGWTVSDDALLPEKLAVTMTGHSERATLTSWAAAIGVPKSERDHMGRWSPSGSDDYVRTYRAIVKKVLAKMVETARATGAYRVFDEPDSIEALGDKCMKIGEDKEIVEKLVVKAKENARAVFEGIEKMMVVLAPAVVEPAGGVAPVGPVEEAQEDEKEDQKEDREAKYVIAEVRSRHSSRTHCTLHSRKGCFRGRELSFKSFELVMLDVPDIGTYDTICQKCWPAGPPVFSLSTGSGVKEGEDSSSSSSASS